MRRIKFVQVAAAIAVLALTTMSAGAPSPARGPLTCFGAASRDPARVCNDRALRRIVVPSPAQARRARNAPCTITESRGPFRVCEFGAPVTAARATFALIGDSHAAHWRAALEVVADAERWHGVSVTLSGCPFSTATRVLGEPLRSDCIERNLEVPDWLAHHPSIHTVFVSELSGARWLLPAAADPLRAQADAYIQAWEKLPASVTHVVVIRDTPKAKATTAACIEHAHAAGRDAGRICAISRPEAIDPDAAVDAATELGLPRFQSIDMNRFFCDRRWCYPVIGGALVQKDLHHLTAVFVGTLGPFLLQAVRRLDLA